MFIPKGATSFLSDLEVVLCVIVIEVVE